MSVRHYPDIGTWITPTLVNGWTDYGAGWAPAGYYVDLAGYVWLRGLIKNAAGFPQQLAFTLPPELWPLTVTSNYPVATANAVGSAIGGEVSISSADGGVRFTLGISGTWSSLSGISFKAQ